MTLLKPAYWNRVIHCFLMIVGCLLNLGFGGYFVGSPIWDKEDRKEARDFLIFGTPFLALGLHFGYMVKVFWPWPPSKASKMPWLSQLIHWLLNIAGVAFFSYVIAEGVQKNEIREDKSSYTVYAGLILHFLTRVWSMRPWHKL